jgi:hypothetical protein
MVLTKEELELGYWVLVLIHIIIVYVLYIRVQHIYDEKL